MKVSTILSLFVLGAIAAPLAEPDTVGLVDRGDSSKNYGKKVEVVYVEYKKVFDNQKQWVDDKKKYWDDNRHQWVNEKNQCWDVQNYKWVDKSKFDSYKIVYEVPKYEAPKYVAPTYTPSKGNNGKPASGWQNIEFKQIYDVKAVPETVIATTGVPTPGQPNAVGYFKLAVNPSKDTICYEITLLNLIGQYSSPARTATHLHQGPKGGSGPPRIAFPNPVGDDKKRYIAGCMSGPFTTGLNATGTTTDTGVGFKVQQILDNPSNFYADTHTVNYPAGAVRGQLA